VSTPDGASDRFGRGVDVIKNWQQILTTRALEWGLPAGNDWTFLFHNNYQPTASTINLLWFYADERFPRAVTKMARDRRILAREYRNLQEMYGVAKRYVPRPMHLGESGGFTMLWMEGVPGQRILGRYSKSLLGELTDILISIHKAVRHDATEPASRRHARLVAEPLEAAIAHGGSAAVRNGCSAVLAAATVEWVAGLPVIPQHGDLYLDNVLQHRDVCRIVDWENYGANDLPFHDLLTLLISFLRASAGRTGSWNPRLRNLIPALIDRYTRALQLSRATVAVILPVTLANWFHLHWTEQRPAAEVMYAVLQHYFEHQSDWQETFLKKGETV
jgi:aminoglycoside phosphotransferase (APT) family kinase protein